MKTKKTFDCVEMKRESAEKIYKQIKNLASDDELKFWHDSKNILYKVKNTKIKFVRI